LPKREARLRESETQRTFIFSGAGDFRWWRASMLRSVNRFCPASAHNATR
jgi:hypothetical protein